MPQILSPEERAAFLPALQETGWQVLHAPDRIMKVWQFDGFASAWAFMSHAALCAEKMDHHPDWRNVYNRVEVTLSTHSCKGLSVLDMELARAFDAAPIRGKVVFASSAPEAGAKATGGADDASDDPNLSEDFLD